MRILTLFVRHGTEKYKDADQRMDELFRRRLPKIERKTIIIDNQLVSRDPESHDDRTEVISGNNENWEFSGWDQAIRHVGRELASYDFVHFATSAYEQLYSRYLERLTEPMLECAAASEVSIGHIDCFNEPVLLFGYVSQHWLRSSFFFVPPVEVKAL